MHWNEKSVILYLRTRVEVKLMACKKRSDYFVAKVFQVLVTRFCEKVM